MTTTLAAGKQISNSTSSQEIELSLASAEIQSIRRLVSSITGAAIQSLTEMSESDYSIGVTMFERWEKAQSELEGMQGKSGLLETSRELRQELQQVFIRGSAELESSERSHLYERTKNLLEKLDSFLEALL